MPVGLCVRVSLSTSESVSAGAIKKGRPNETDRQTNRMTGRQYDLPATVQEVEHLLPPLAEELLDVPCRGEAAVKHTNTVTPPSRARARIHNQGAHTDIIS